MSIHDSRLPSKGMRTRPEERLAKASESPAPDTLSPADRYEELFVEVQQNSVFPDSKTFVDCAPKGLPHEILAAYRAECQTGNFDLRSFVARHFAAPRPAVSHYKPAKGQSIVEHIDGLWDVLTRHPALHPKMGSHLQLPHPYVVPGGRFIEMYYWDSYFTMLGLAEGSHEALLHAMTDNFAYLIDTYGHVPNGTRTYYLSRSQPPVFALMAELCESCGGQEAAHYLPQLLKEYRFWMDGAKSTRSGDANRRVVRLPDGALLNRYWDDRDTPREESWREDVATATGSSRPAAQVYRDLRAAAESGWDFSSRWLDNPEATPDGGASLSSIRTTSILPVDLNALLYKLETTISRLSAIAGNQAQADSFQQHGSLRSEAMNRYLWNVQAGAFLDYDWEKSMPRPNLTAATVVPLFTRMASQAQADALATTVEKRLLAPGGLGTTELVSGEQWDRPNGWAPLQWMAVEGLDAYGHANLAGTIRTRWLDTVQDVYSRENKLVEKYALRETSNSSTRSGEGGEYPVQDGFGWTNGVVSQWRSRNGNAVE